MGKYFEDFNVGDKFVTPGKTITEGAIATMVGLAGFVLPLFNDEEYARTTIFGGRIAPGRLTLFVMGGLVEQTGLFEDTVIALVGLDNIRFRAPLRAGDTIRVEIEITAKKETSRSDRGLITHRETCRNQRGEIVVEAESTHLLKRRQA
jgi:acyl dehydratase